MLFFRADRDQRRAVWPLAVGLTQQTAEQWHGYEWTVEGSVAAWAMAVRELQRTGDTAVPETTVREQA